MIETSYDSQNGFFVITYGGHVHLQELYDLIGETVDNQELSNHLRVCFDSRKGECFFSFNEITLKKMGLDRLIERFESVTIASIRKSREDESTEFFDHYCQKIGIRVEHFSDSDSARYFLKKMRRSVRETINT